MRNDTTDTYEKKNSPLIPRHDYNDGRVNKQNYPITYLNVQNQSTIFQCAKDVNNLPQFFDLPMSAHKLKLE